MQRSLVFSLVVLAMAFGSAITAHAQAADVSVGPDTPAPGAAVTVTVTGAPAGEPVVVQLGTEEATGTTDGSGNATVTIAAPNNPGQAVGTVRVGLVDFPFDVVVQESGGTAATTTTTATTAPATTTTTVPPPTTPPPVTGIDNAATLVGLGAALMAAGFGLTALARRPSAANVTRGSVTYYRIDAGRRRRPSIRRR